MVLENNNEGKKFGSMQNPKNPTDKIQVLKKSKLKYLTDNRQFKTR